MNTILKPFLKWAGGKRKLTPHLEPIFPFKKDDEFTYIEPFVGGGAVLFWVLSNYPNLKKAVISDKNEKLINTYSILKFQRDDLIKSLKEIESNYLSKSKDDRKIYYYKLRKLFNEVSSEVDSSAIFIFLNRTCFNGLYRENNTGQFNVSHGSYRTPTICDEENLHNISKALRKVEIVNEDFRTTLSYIPLNKQAVFYLDPPYLPISKTSNFTNYTACGFFESDHYDLATFINVVTMQRVYCILSSSNPDGELVLKQYRDYNISKIQMARSINSNSTKRKSVEELLITNFEQVNKLNDFYFQRMCSRSV